MLALSGRAGLVKTAFFSLLLGWISSATITHAAGECGLLLPGQTVVSCTAPAPGEYASGISYSTSTGLTVNVGSNIVVTRTPGFDLDGVSLGGSGAGDLIVNIDAGAIISTNASNADAVSVQSNGLLSGNIYIRSAGTMNVAGGAGSAVGLYGKITNDNSTGNIEITNLAAGVINITGGGNRAIEALQESGAPGALGAIKLYNYGVININTPTVDSIGISGWIKNPLSTANVETHLGNTGSITMTTRGGTGIYTLQNGQGNALGSVAGVIDMTGTSNAGVFAYTNDPLANGRADVEISATGRISVNGDRSIGAAAYTDGTGATRITHAGTIIGTGTSVNGIETGTGVGNVETHVVELIGNASVQITGDRSDGAYFSDGGTSSASYTLADRSVISTNGALSDGIDAVLGSGNATFRLAPAAAITVTGAQSIALKTRTGGLSTSPMPVRSRQRGNMGLASWRNLHPPQRFRSAQAVPCSAAGSLMWPVSAQQFPPPPPVCSSREQPLLSRTQVL